MVEHKYTQQKKSGKTRPDLYAKLANIWRGLEEAVGNSTGFFWGDPSDDYYYEDDLKFIREARSQLFLGLKVFYNSSW